MKCIILGIRNSFATAIAYRADYFMRLFILTLSDLIVPFVSLVIYQSGVSFPGWSLYEILMIQGIYIIVNGIADTLFGGFVSHTLYLVKNGNYDMVLLKPRSPVFISVINSFDLEGLGKILTGIGLCTAAAINMDIEVTLTSIGLFILLLLLAESVIFSFCLLLAATGFVWIGNSRLFEIFESITSFGRYPAAIYPKILRNIVMYMVPAALMGYLPASALLGRFEGNLFILIIGTLIFAFGSYVVWRIMLPGYMSAGG